MPKQEHYTKIKEAEQIRPHKKTIKKNKKTFVKTIDKLFIL